MLHIRQILLTVIWSADFQRTARPGSGKPICYPTLRKSHVTLTTWENLGGPVLSEEILMTTWSVVMFAANNNTSRLLENTSNKSDSTHTYILIITLYTNTHEHNIQQHCHAFLIWILWSLNPVKQNKALQSTISEKSSSLAMKWNRTKIQEVKLPLSRKLSTVWNKNTVWSFISPCKQTLHRLTLFSQRWDKTWDLA